MARKRFWGRFARAESEKVARNKIELDESSDDELKLQSTAPANKPVRWWCFGRRSSRAQVSTEPLLLPYQ